MQKNIYIVRHCEAQGQPPESLLTEKGHEQAIELARFFSSIPIDHILSSHFLRAIQSVEPLSKEKKINIEIDNRLAERTLSSRDLPDWPEKLHETFDDLDLKYEGGESSKEAMERIVSVVEEAFDRDRENTISYARKCHVPAAEEL
ncbi:MAG: histidine phosphatase family protein [Bacillota bacterium]